MENIVTLLIPAVLTVLAVKLLLTPMKWGLRAAVHACSGFICLWLVNAASAFTGLTLPVNAVTVLLSAFLGLPGMALIALLEIM